MRDEVGSCFREWTDCHVYLVLRIFEMPPVKVYFVESGARPLGGVGEVGPVTVIAALANAVFAATAPAIARCR